MRSILDRASIAQRLIRALFVVPPQPVPNDPPRLLERLKPMLSDTFLFETPKEPFNDPILFRRIRRDELLLQPIVSTGLSKSPTLEDQPIVAAEDRCALRTQGSQIAADTPLRPPVPPPLPDCAGRTHSPSLPDHAINDRRQMRPTILSTINMRHIHGPAFVAAIRPTRPALHARAWGGDALMHEPPVLLQHTIDGLPIDEKSVPESQQHPQPPIPKRWILLEQLPQPLRPRRIRHRASRFARFRPMQARAAETEYLATPPLRDTRQRASHASDVFRSKG